MRLLFVIDSYPPSDRGGYAQLCYDLAHEIRRHEHDVTVLCAGPALPQHDTEQVVRRLAVPVRWEDRWPVPVQQTLFAANRSRHNLRVLDQTLVQAKPDAILLWPTGYVDQYLMAAAESYAGSVAAYYVAGVSPTDPTILEQYWKNPGRSTVARVAKRLLHPILGCDQRSRAHLALRHVMCVSDYERRRVVAAGVLEDNTHVVYNGIDPARFQFLGLPSTRRKPGHPLRVLYIGRLVEDKGAHTLVDAIALLRRENSAIAITATLLGAGPAGYVQQIDTAIASHRLADVVQRREWVVRSDMPAVMANHDVLVLPTIRPEALSRAVQEAMAMGLPVVATPTGGTPEIVRTEVTGLTFAPENAHELALCLRQLYHDPSLADRLAKAGRALVMSEFTLEKMAERVEQQLAQWFAQ